MNFKRQARDKTNQIITEGDILQLVDTNIAVVQRVVRFGREQFPELHVTLISTDFLGKNISTTKEALTSQTYRRCRKLDPVMLRDDVPKHAKAKNLRESAITNNSPLF